MLVWVSRQASLYSSLQYLVGVLHLGVEKWHRESESAGQMSLPVTCQAASLSLLCCGIGQVSLPVTCHAVSDHMILPVTRAQTSRPGHHCRKTWPQGSFHLLVSAPRSCHTGDSNSCPPDLELGALTRSLGSRCWSECLGKFFYKLMKLCKPTGKMVIKYGKLNREIKQKVKTNKY
jgi:hypothetical protein